MAIARLVGAVVVFAFMSGCAGMRSSTIVEDDADSIKDRIYRFSEELEESTPFKRHALEDIAYTTLGLCYLPRKAVETARLQNEQFFVSSFYSALIEEHLALEALRRKGDGFVLATISHRLVTVANAFPISSDRSLLLWEKQMVSMYLDQVTRTEGSDFVKAGICGRKNISEIFAAGPEEKRSMFNAWRRVELLRSASGVAREEEDTGAALKK